MFSLINFDTALRIASHLAAVDGLDLSRPRVVTRRPASRGGRRPRPSAAFFRPICDGGSALDQRLTESGDRPTISVVGTRQSVFCFMHFGI